MSWPNFLAPWWGLMGLVAVPIILLYLLRQRRPDMVVSSTLLWSKTLADMRASTPFQKLRRNLLLLLQLLILAALVFTLMRPVVQARATQTQAGVIVIDSTASMQTRDGGPEGSGDGETRLDRAKAEARTLVDTMRPGDQYMLIADGGGMLQVRSGFTASKSELKTLIESIKPGDTGSDLSESLLLAATSLRAIGAEQHGDGGRRGTGPGTGGASSVPKGEAVVAGKIWLFSDGAGVHVPDAMGENNDLLRFVRIGSSHRSVGITRLSITPVPRQPRRYQVFVGLLNAWDVEKKIGVLLAYGTKDNFMPNQARLVAVPAGGTASVVFENVEVDPGKLFVRLDDTDDDFPLDNTAYGLIAPPRKVRVTLVTSGNELLEKLVRTAAALGTVEAQILTPDSYNPATEADLFILDGFLPAADKLPKADTILVRPMLSASANGTTDIAGFRVSHTIDNPSILQWRREDPVMQYVELSELRISRALLMDKDAGAVELVSSMDGPLIAYKDFGSVRRYFISFSPMTESNWWGIPSLIVFMQNAIDQTRLRHFIGLPQMLASGTPARLWNIGGTGGGGGGGEKGEGTARITTPDGTVTEIVARDGTAEFGATDKVGFYEVDTRGSAQATGGPTRSLFAVNLLSPSESNIRPQTLKSATGSNVEEVTNVARVNREIWQWLAAAALAVLLLEWWIYHRRVV